MITRTKGAGGKDRDNREITSNYISASFRVGWNAKAIVFLPGDVDSIGLDDLNNHNISFEPPVLVFPHHGGKTDNSDLATFTKQICYLSIAL